MINAVYQLVTPRMIDITYKEIDMSKGETIIRPLYLAICNADQRYYQGKRAKEVLAKKLPMALIHECVAEIVYDPSGTFKPGEKVIPIPNTPTQTDDVIAENYLRSSHFRSSGYDGFLQDYVAMPAERLVKIPNDANLEVAAFTEIVSVSMHTISRFDKIAHSRKNAIGVWGDGTLGFITALLLKNTYPNTKIYTFGLSDEKLNYFSFDDGTFHVDSIPEDLHIDHAFECVGGMGSESAINQIIDIINPEGTVAIMGVSENFVNINTRMILEKGLRFFGSSRSGRKDFVKTVEMYKTHPMLESYFENLVGNVIDVREITDIHRAFEIDINKNFGKTIMKWDK